MGTFRERQHDHHKTDRRDRQHDDDFAIGGLSGGWGGGSSSNRLTISGPGYSRTVGKDGSVKQSFEQTTTGKSKRSQAALGSTSASVAGHQGDRAPPAVDAPPTRESSPQSLGVSWVGAAEQADQYGDAAGEELAPRAARFSRTRSKLKLL